MKVEVRLFLVMVVFCFIMTGVYWYATDGQEHVGLVALPLTGAMCAMIAGYIAITARKLDARPDDNPDGEIAEAEGEYGFFAPHSWWPLALASSGALVFLGAAIGWWLVILGVPLLALATVGWTFEYFRGDDAV
ncbi:cytochrome c oxidase subunit 4 [Dermacoccaceae bacterium W4C1]